MADKDNKKGGLVPAGAKAIVPGKGQPGKGMGILAGGKASFKPPVVVKKGPSLPAGQRAELLAAALAPKEKGGKLVYGFDATASRAPAWDRSKKIQDALFEAIPGRLEAALAVHGGSALHTFTAFTGDPSKLRDLAAGIQCQAGGTQLVPMMERTVETDASVLVYVGDVFEEYDEDARNAADKLKLKGCRVIILQDGDDPGSAHVFREIAKRTGGAVLPFGSGSVSQLRDLLQAVGVLAVGGRKLLESKQKTLPGATLLLKHLPPE